MDALGYDGEPLSLELVILEYQQLKEEQRLRIASRDKMLYATLVSVGAVSAAALQTQSSPALLVLPVVGVVLGWTYVSNDRKVSQIGRYIRQTARLLSLSPNLFGWESSHRRVFGYRRHRMIQTAVAMLAFCLPGAFAVIANVPAAIRSPLVLLAVLVEAIVLVLLGQQILTSPDTPEHRPSGDLG